MEISLFVFNNKDTMNRYTKPTQSFPDLNEKPISTVKFDSYMCMIIKIKVRFDNH